MRRLAESRTTMQRQRIGWIIAIIATALLSVAVARSARLPGDVSITGFLQSVAPADNSWAEALTTSARIPWNFLLLAVTFILSWLIAGWRAAALAAVCFAGLLLIGPWLQGVIARPRPSPSLVRVVGSSSGYSFPSIFALTYASTAGYLAVLAWRALAGRTRLVAVLACALLLIVGGSARVVLGAHWPSDVVASYLIGLVWAALLISLFLAHKPRRAKS
jgi:membrane-associated phospholipid phosphatase